MVCFAGEQALVIIGVASLRFPFPFSRFDRTHRRLPVSIRNRTRSRMASERSSARCFPADLSSYS
jgi:hypothetical protein